MRMILFVSGRCDIPAYYSAWFFQRLKEGFVDVRNPYNPHQISRIPLSVANVDALLFCTKNPMPLLPRLDEIPFPYLFHVTVTPYHRDIEPYVPNKKEVIQAVKQLSERIGKDRVVVRYDPILLSDRYDIAYHGKAFEKLVKSLHGAVDTIIISFVDMYKNTRMHKNSMYMLPMSEKDMRQLGKVIGSIAMRYGIRVQTCAEGIDLSAYGVQQGACVSKELMEHLLQHPYEAPKGAPLRNCKCIPTVDIGDYNACANLCKYCYANYDENAIRQRMRTHDPLSSVLLGHITKEDVITVRQEKAVRQTMLFS